MPPDQIIDRAVAAGADAVKAAGLGEIDKRKVEIREQVRTVGTYQATVRLHEDVNANVEFEVVPA